MSKLKTEPPRTHIQLMKSQPEYAEQMEALQHTVYGTSREQFLGDAILAEQFRNHIKVFPQGQYIAVDTERNLVVGLTVSMRVSFDPKNPKSHSVHWRQATNDGWLDTHDPEGNWMYGVESAVHPDYQGYGIGRVLMDARRHVIRKLNLRGMVAGGTLKDYHRHHQTMKPQEYLRRVERGELFDTNISKQIRMGFKPVAIIPNYVDDPDTLGYAALIVWHNPDYHPERAPQRVRAPQYAFSLRDRKQPPHVQHGGTHYSDSAGV